MMKCLYLLSVVFHVAAGCALSADNLTEITRRRGDSLLLPCSCSDLNTKPQTLTWVTGRTGHWTEVLNDQHYSGRLQLFNNISPANLSLLISDLRVEDQGDYRCSTGPQGHRDIWLYVDGCELVKKTEVEHVTVFTGESVVLPCVCTDIQDKPQDLKWFNRNNHYQEIYPKQTGHHRNRVKLVSNNSPGNLSLLISHLTEEDQGEYTCSVQNNEKQIRLSVKGRRETSTHWRKTDTTPPSEQPQSKTTHSPPASSSTTLEQGRRETSTPYRKTDINLLFEQSQSKTTHSPPASSSTKLQQDNQQTHSNLTLVFGILAVLLFMIIASVALICWRCRGGRCGRKVIAEGHQDCKMKQKTVPDAVYGNVTNVNTARPARIQISVEEENEYASIL